jgi:N-acetylneuraminic acid mutarotase
VARPGGAWNSVRRLPSPRWAAAAVGDRDGRIYVLGGFATKDSHHAVTAIDVYTPATDAWSQAGLMPSPRGAMATVAAPTGEIYALGGTDGPEFTNVDIYDPTTDSWRTGPRLPRARSGLGAGIDADGRVYAVGGYADRHAVAEVDVLESGGRAWAASTPLPLPLYAPVATTADGRIFVVGGATDTRGLWRIWELVWATAP